MSVDVENLSDEEVLAILQELTAEIREELTLEERDSVDTEEKARQVLASLTDRADPYRARDMSEESAWAIAASRQVLAAVLQDPGSGDLASRLAEEPPKNEQMVVLGGLEVVIVLGALVTLLQTKMHLKVERKGGKTDVSFEVKKDASDSSLISQVVKIAGGLFGAGA